MSQAYAAYAAQAAQAAAAAAPRQVGQNTGPWDELADEHNTGRLQGISGVESAQHVRVPGGLQSHSVHRERGRCVWCLW